MHATPRRIALAALSAVFVAEGAVASHASFDQANAQSARVAQADGAVQGGIVTEQRRTGAFSAIELAGPYRVVIDAQARQAVQVSGGRKQLDELRILMRGDTLVVRPIHKMGFSFSFGKRRETVPTITIGAFGLKRLRTSGSGDVDLEHAFGDHLTLASAGPGDLHASGAVRQLAVETAAAATSTCFA